MLTKTYYSVKENDLESAVSFIFEKYPSLLLNDKEKIVLNQPLGDFFYDPWTLKAEYKGSPLESIYDSLNGKKGEARIISMQPGVCYMAHSDIDNRWHLSLSGSESYLIDLETQNMFDLKQDKLWWYMDASKRHTAANFGDSVRIQIVIRELLQYSENATHSISIKPLGTNGRFIFDKNISPFLNFANKQNKLAKFSINNDTVHFVLCKTMIEQFKKLNLEKMVINYGIL